MLIYVEIVLQKEKYNKAFFYLNHCLKFDYRNPKVWYMLGEVYKFKSLETCHDRIYNTEKAAFCFSKATKYENRMSEDCLHLLRMIPKYII